MRFPWSRGRADHRARAVVGGRLMCPSSGDVDVERCVDCPRLESVEQTDDGRLQVTCKAPSRWSESLIDGHARGLELGG